MGTARREPSLPSCLSPALFQEGLAMLLLLAKPQHPSPAHRALLVPGPPVTSCSCSALDWPLPAPDHWRPQFPMGSAQASIFCLLTRYCICLRRHLLPPLDVKSWTRSSAVTDRIPGVLRGPPLLQPACPALQGSPSPRNRPRCHNPCCPNTQPCCRASKCCGTGQDVCSPLGVVVSPCIM